MLWNLDPNMLIRKASRTPLLLTQERFDEYRYFCVDIITRRE